ncbi:uncharacterized protein LOC118458428 [Anopheles albimanus]|uniref:uncharacterized protein LOC118458428 n=1 Tax=Anopheles albimanus TaxID=7167 RepID=UPI00164058C9|nr:uncharacterized protein LOC118458428 [Anopheles albimanus]
MCLKQSECRWDHNTAFSNNIQNAVFIQLFYNFNAEAVKKHALQLKAIGVLKAVQLSVNPSHLLESQVYVYGAFMKHWIGAKNNSDAVNLLFSKEIKNMENFIYNVAHIPMHTQSAINSKAISGLEIGNFLTILKKQKAMYRFHKNIDLGNLIRKMMNGEIDVLLNPLKLSIDYVERVYWKDFTYFCIIFPRRYERMHIQLLLSPFQWHIWMVIVLIILVVQMLCVLFPKRLHRNLILKCFFGGGVPEHVLTADNRLIVCSVCVLIFLLTETYQAILLSLMSADPFVKNPQTVEEVVAEKQPILALKGMEGEYQTELKNLVQELNMMYASVVKQNVTITNCDTGYYLNHEFGGKNVSDLIVIQPPLFNRHKFIVFSYMSPATEAYKLMMSRMVEVGIYQYEKKEWFPKRIYEQREQTFNDMIVLPEDLVPVWELFGTGLCLGFLIFIVECSLYWIQERSIFKIVNFSKKNVYDIFNFNRRHIQE